MKKIDSNLVGPLLQYFFVDYMCAQKRTSPETIASYRDTFRLLLQFVHDTHGVVPSDLKVADLDVPLILSFLDHIEQVRKNSVRSRNLRLAAIRSFFRAAALRCASGLFVVAPTPIAWFDDTMVGGGEIEQARNHTRRAVVTTGRAGQRRGYRCWSTKCTFERRLQL